jgi:hypothetical protein
LIPDGGNISQAVKKDPSFVKNVKKLVCWVEHSLQLEA